jgi:hypothetical protein
VCWLSTESGLRPTEPDGSIDRSDPAPAHAADTLRCLRPFRLGQDDFAHVHAGANAKRPRGRVAKGPGWWGLGRLPARSRSLRGHRPQQGVSRRILNWHYPRVWVTCDAGPVERGSAATFRARQLRTPPGSMVTSANPIRVQHLDPSSACQHVLISGHFSANTPGHVGQRQTVRVAAGGNRPGQVPGERVAQAAPDGCPHAIQPESKIKPATTIRPQGGQ